MGHLLSHWVTIREGGGEERVRSGLGEGEGERLSLKVEVKLPISAKSKYVCDKCVRFGQHVPSSSCLDNAQKLFQEMM